MFELNSGSIENIGIFIDPIEFFQANCAKSDVKLKTIKSNGKSRVKSHKLETNDQNKKGAQS